jgi:thioredoxin-related protein
MLIQFEEQEKYEEFLRENNYSAVFIASRKCLYCHYLLNFLYEKEDLFQSFPILYLDINDFDPKETIGVQVEVVPTFLFFQKSELVYKIEGLNTKKILEKIKKYDSFSKL